MQNQYGKWSADDKKLLESTFGSNEELLFQVRDVFYQFPTEIPKLQPEVINLVRRLFDTRLDQNVGLRMQDGIYRAVDVKNLPPEIAVLHIEAFDIVINYIRKQLLVLEGKEEQGSGFIESLKEPGNKDWKQRFKEMMAYLTLVHSYIDMQIETLRASSQKEPSEQEKKAKEQQDSTK